ncbi:MAG: tetratricopeptide repeat protein [Sphingomicrobium sp.]
MRTSTAKSIILVGSACLSTAALAQSHDEQIAACKSGDPNSLVEKIAGCTALIASGQESSDNLALIFNNRGNAYDDQNDFAHAIADYDQSIRYDAQNPMAYMNRGLSYSYQHDYGHAIADLNEAIRLNPQYAKAYLARGRTERSQGKTAEGDADIARACAIDQRMC